MDAGNGQWFTVLERESLSNLLNERKIIRQTRKQYTNGDKALPALPPLLYAPILLDGGIVAYESNLLSGGMGARYFGAGGFTEFRRDTVTVDLRAVSVKQGTILNTLQTRKTILSAKLEGGLFRFVDPLRLLEIEAGISSNEAPQMAVREAIELAVYGMILEGVQDKLWAFKDPDAAAPIYATYFNDKHEKLESAFNKNGQLVKVIADEESPSQVVHEDDVWE
jgi:curli production assembly/transport component CsgG